MARIGAAFSPPKAPVIESAQSPPKQALGASEGLTISTFDDKNITYGGDQANYDYDSILRNKQGNIQSLFQLSDYYTDADPIYRGIIKGVYTPFSIANSYKLVGASEQVKKKYEDYYKRIYQEDKMRSIFYQYFKYANVYVYQMPDGNLITLPVHKVRIANITMNGEPVIELNSRSIRDDLRTLGVQAQKDYVHDEQLEVRLDGFPPEVADAVKNNQEWVQLNPENTFVLQDIKEDWARYAVPMVASCLPAFSKKALIAKYEKALLNRGIASFLHVTYGDKDGNALADQESLNQLTALFKKTLTGGAVVSTNNYVKAEMIETDTSFLFEDDHYREVNADILAAGGISGVIVSGQSDDGSTFASAKISMETAEIRIKQARDNFCEMMNKINMRLNSVLPRSSEKNIPKFTFPPVDLAGSQKFQDVCYKLWQSGVLSTNTMLQIHGFDIEQEINRKKEEEKRGIADILTKRDDVRIIDDGENGKMGRPKQDDDERNSDESKSETGRAPKPSAPEGSKPQE